MHARSLLFSLQGAIQELHRLCADASSRTQHCEQGKSGSTVTEQQSDDDALLKGAGSHDDAVETLCNAADIAAIRDAVLRYMDMMM